MWLLCSGHERKPSALHVMNMEPPKFCCSGPHRAFGTCVAVRQDLHKRLPFQPTLFDAFCLVQFKAVCARYPLGLLIRVSTRVHSRKTSRRVHDASACGVSLRPRTLTPMVATRRTSFCSRTSGQTGGSESPGASFPPSPASGFSRIFCLARTAR